MRRMSPILLGLAMVLTACDGPSLADTGRQLADDGRTVMEWKRWKNPRTTETADRDVPCDGGKSKRVFAGSAERLFDTSDHDNALDVFQDSISARFIEIGYEHAFEGNYWDEVVARKLDWVKEKDGATLRFTAVLTIPREDVIAVAITGETSCF